MASEDSRFSDELRRALSLAKTRLAWDERSEWDAFWTRRRDRRRHARIVASITALVIGAAGLAFVLPLRSTGANTPVGGSRTLRVITRIDTGLVPWVVAASGDSVWVAGADPSSSDGYLVGFSDSGSVLAKTGTTRVTGRLVVDSRGVLVAGSTSRRTTTRYSWNGQDVYDLKGISGTIAESGGLLWGTTRGQSVDTAALVAYDLATLAKVAHVELKLGVHDLAAAGGTVFAITTSPLDGPRPGSTRLVSVSDSGISPVMSDVLAGILIPAADGVWIMNYQRRACLASVSSIRCLPRSKGMPVAWTNAGLWMVDPSREVLSLVDAENGTELASLPLPGSGPATMSQPSVAGPSFVVSPDGDGNSVWIASADGSLEQVAAS